MSIDKQFEQVEAHLTLFLQSVTPKRGDPTYSVLKAHLLFEELLRDAVLRELPHPEALNGSRLTFSQLLAIARASAKRIQPDHWQWEAVGKLNKLRNLLAHHLASSEVQKKMDELVEFIVAGFRAPLPSPDGPKVGEPLQEGAPYYLAIDMVLVSLYGSLANSLGFDSKARLAADHERSDAFKEVGK